MKLLLHLTNYKRGMVPLVLELIGNDIKIILKKKDNIGQSVLKKRKVPFFIESKENPTQIYDIVIKDSLFLIKSSPFSYKGRSYKHMEDLIDLCIKNNLI